MSDTPEGYAWRPLGMDDIRAVYELEALGEAFADGEVEIALADIEADWRMLNFDPASDLAGIFQPLPEHQGYPGRLHGGVSSAILDETIGRAINMLHADVWGVTVELTLRYRRPVPLDGEVRAVGRITKDSRRLFEGTGEIVLADGSVAVEASGKYLRLPIERIDGEGFDGSQWFPDERESPDEVEI